MPLITVKMFEGELADAQARDLIHNITEAVATFVGEKLTEKTWVLT